MGLFLQSARSMTRTGRIITLGCLAAMAAVLADAAGGDFSSPTWVHSRQGHSRRCYDNDVKKLYSVVVPQGKSCDYSTNHYLEVASRKECSPYGRCASGSYFMFFLYRHGVHLGAPTVLELSAGYHEEDDDTFFARFVRSGGSMQRCMESFLEDTIRDNMKVDLKKHARGWCTLGNCGPVSTLAIGRGEPAYYFSNRNAAGIPDEYYIGVKVDGEPVLFRLIRAYKEWDQPPESVLAEYAPIVGSVRREKPEPASGAAPQADSPPSPAAKSPEPPPERHLATEDGVNAKPTVDTGKAVPLLR